MKTTQLLDFGSNILRSKKIVSHRIDSEVILSYILKISREKLLIKEEKVCNENIIKFTLLADVSFTFEDYILIYNKSYTKPITYMGSIRKSKDLLWLLKRSLFPDKNKRNIYFTNTL